MEKLCSERKAQSADNSLWMSPADIFSNSALIPGNFTAPHWTAAYSLPWPVSSVGWYADRVLRGKHLQTDTITSSVQWAICSIKILFPLHEKLRDYENTVYNGKDLEIGKANIIINIQGKTWQKDY